MVGDPFDMDERVKNYLKSRGQRADPDSPEYKYGIGAIEQGGLQGIARGMAQMGTVHGKTPSAEPFVESSKQGMVGMEALAKQPAIDPQVMKYILDRTKPVSTGNKTTIFQKGPPTPEGFATTFDTSTGTYKETSQKVKVPPPPGSAPHKPNLTENKQAGIAKQGLLSEKQYQDATTGEGAWNPTKQFQFIDSSNMEFMNQFKSPKAQNAHAAMRAWVETFLRDASGAAIAPSESSKYFSTYFPTGGDNPVTVEQKKQQRMQKVRSAAANGWITEAELNQALGGGVSPTPAQTPQKPKGPLPNADQIELERRRKLKQESLKGGKP